MDFTDPVVQKYLLDVLPERDETLREMERQAEKRDIPIVGPAVGRLFYQLARIARAKTVFELGSAIGYSTIWWARGVGEGGRVVYTDSNKKNADEARRYFERAGVSERVDIRVGDALEIFSEEKPSSYDIVFNDVDKEDYPRVFRLAAPRVRKGGLFVTDNVLWSGHVARAALGAKSGGKSNDPEASSAATKAIVEFNKLLYGSQDFFTTIMPLRDGVAIALRNE
jgi:predicted O-methyltransferase YrrM